MQTWMHCCNKSECYKYNRVTRKKGKQSKPNEWIVKNIKECFWTVVCV